MLAATECCICHKKKTDSSKSGYEILVKCVTESSAEKLKTCCEQWTRFMENGNNKTELIEFLFREWSHPTRHVEMFHPNTILYVNHGGKISQIKYRRWVNELRRSRRAPY